ncbi:MAG TPA: S9 family peptidase [Sandaracinaceae bacterium LLY-WYZ-13_1]|nr:S9 family peptidase [Sandaracinaceae bacterium LLY-WYZ-13_1]
MRRIRSFLAATLAVLAGCGGARPVSEGPETTASAEPSTDGPPRPEDVPSVDEPELGLAGASEPDVVRYLMVRRAWAPRLSPDGARLAFRTAITGEPQLWTVDADGGWPRQLTFGHPVTFHAWAPTGEHILYGTDRGGNEREGYYLVSPDGTHERELLPPTEAFRVFGGFSRDGRRIAYATTEGGSASFDLHVMELATGEDRRVYEGRLGLYVAAWRPDGEALVIGETRGEDANDLHLLDLRSGELTTLFAPEGEDEASAFESIAWKPDGSGFYLASDRGRNLRGLAFVDASSGALSWVETPERDVERVSLSNDGRWLAWTENDGGRSALRVRDLERDRMLEPPEGLPRGIYAPTFAREADVMAIAVGSPRIPGDVWVWRLSDGTLARATHSTLAGLDPDALVEPTHVDFEARDGETLHGLLYLPPEGAAERTPPVLLHVHGGPTAQARPRFSAILQYLLARGIAVLDLNFRGSTGYGKRYARLDNRRRRPDAVNDMADALDWLARDGRVDAERAAVMGGSYGGYMTFAALVTFPRRFAGGVSFVGVSNWITALEGASPQLRASDRLEYGDIEDPEDRAFFEQLSPITHVDRLERPLLVSHGANDPRDPVSESDRFVRAAREQGVEVEYVRFEDEGHGVRHLRNRVYLYRRVAAFLEHVLEVR